MDINNIYYEKLAEILFPDVVMTVQDMEEKYPPRNLPEDAKVTRFAPSPTGFVHFGGLFPTRVSERLAHQSGGVFLLRIEDTDSKREVEGAEENLISTLESYGIVFDEGATAGGGDNGVYGPYRQSLRKPIYHVFAKDLVKRGFAYPCFCTEDELSAIRAEQEAEKVDPGYYGKWAVWRDAPIEKIEERLSAGEKFVLRFRSNGNPEHKMKFSDLVKGQVEITENDRDHVLLKSDGIPTYHFAHAVDDHLMRTTHVVRGEEWLSSLPFHIQLFSALGFRLPKYLHISQLMKLEGNSKKKLSKRDHGVDMRWYDANGYAPEALTEYVMTLLNSNYEEWRNANPAEPFEKFPFSIKKMSTSGCLLDMDKLTDVSKNTIAAMSAEKVYDSVLAWARKYDGDFAVLLARDPEYAKRILRIGRGGKKPRKDIAVWTDVKPYMGFFYDELFKAEDEIPDGFDPADIKNILLDFAASYNVDNDSGEWFSGIKAIADKYGYASDMKAYRQNPSAFKGSVADVSMFIRVAVTGRLNSPDMYEVMQILGSERVVSRVKAAAGRF